MTEILYRRSTATRTPEFERPRYANDCGACVFLGRHGIADLYWCAQGFEMRTLIARFSHAEGDTISGWPSTHPELIEAARRAVARGLPLTEGTPTMPTDTPTEPTTITVVSYEDGPLEIDLSVWQVIAELDDGDAYLCVRKHPDGRQVVYGWSQDEPGDKSGAVVGPNQEHMWGKGTIQAIRRVAGSLFQDWRDLADDLIAKLPPRRI